MRLIDADYQRECLFDFAGGYLASGNPTAITAGKVMMHISDEVLDAQPTIDPETLPIVQELREKLSRYEQDCGRAPRVCEVFFRKPNTVEKALFHRWTDKSQLVEPSMMRGGHNGGIIMCTYGIVEFENGRVCEVLPSQIRFLDTKVCMDKAEWENTNRNHQR